MIRILSEIKNSDKVDLYKEFHKLNKEVFNNEIILNFSLKWANIKTKAGVVKFNSIKRGKRIISEEITALIMSDYFDFPVDEIINILIHEMIHVLISQRKQYNDPGGYHGIYFKREKDRVNKQFPHYNVKPTENVADYEVEKSFAKGKIYKGFILQKGSFIIFKNMSDDELNDFINLLKRQTRISNKDFIIEYFESSDPFLLKFSIARSLKTSLRRQYALEPHEYDKLKDDVKWKKIIKPNGDVVDD